MIAAGLPVSGSVASTSETGGAVIRRGPIVATEVEWQVQPPTFRFTTQPGPWVFTAQPPAWEFDTETSPWKFTAQAALWQFTVETIMSIRSDSVELIYGTWTGAVPLDFDPPHVGFAPSENGTPDQYYPMTWSGPIGYSRTASVLVGPGSDVGVLPVGRHFLIGDLAANPEDVKKCGGYVDVV